MPRQSIVKFIYSKAMKNSWKQIERNDTFPLGGTPVQMIAYLSWKTMEARKRWHNIFSHAERQEQSTQNFICRGSNLRNEEKIEIFSNEGKLREFIVSSPNVKLMAEAHALHEKGMIKEGKETISKNMGSI